MLANPEGSVKLWGASSTSPCTPAPRLAWISAMEAPSLWPTTMGAHLGLGQDPAEDCRLVVQEPERPGHGGRIGLPVARAGVHQRAAASLLGQPLREIPPQRDAAKPFVQEHQSRRLLGRRPQPPILQADSTHLEKV